MAKIRNRDGEWVGVIKRLVLQQKKGKKIFYQNGDRKSDFIDRNTETIFVG